MSSRNEDTRCKGVTKRGEPCRAAATAGGLCFFHANPNKASELGRIGGRRNRHIVVEIVDPLPVLNNVLVVRDTVARLISDVYARKLQPKIAAGLAPLLNLQLRTIETVTELEKQAAEVKAKQALEDNRNPEDLTDAEIRQKLSIYFAKITREANDLAQEQAARAFGSEENLEVCESLNPRGGYKSLVSDFLDRCSAA
jgi:hypothetical protein